MLADEPRYRCIGCKRPAVWLDDHDGFRWAHENDRTAACEPAPQGVVLPAPPANGERGPRTRRRWNLSEQ
jgi:hypothetical protein